MADKNKKNIKYIYLASYFIPFLGMLVCYLCNGIFPGGTKTPLYFDLRSQYFAFHAFLKQLGNGFNGIMFQTFSGLGGGYFGTWAYYTGNPLSFIVCLFPDSYLPYAISLIALIKIGLCGLNFSIFLTKGSPSVKRALNVILFSTCYALMSYNMAYSINPMFLDGVLTLPLVILGIDLILEGKSGTLLGISVFLSILFCYYMAFMVILFSFIWFIYREFSDGLYTKHIFNDIKKCIIPGTLGVFCSSFVIIPVIIDMKRGRLNENVVSGLSFILRNPLDVIKGFIPFSFNGFMTYDPPFVFFGTIPLLFFVLFFVCGKIDKRKKISALAVTVVFFFSFMILLLDTLWTAGSVTNGYPARYSFAACFFFLAVSVSSFEEFADVLVKKHLLLPLFVISIAEVLFNAGFLLKTIPGHYEGYSDYNEYLKLENVMTDFESVAYSDNIEFARTYKFWDYTQNDGLLYGIQSIDYFSSSYNYGLHEFLGKMGLEQHYHHLTDRGLTPFTEKLLGISDYCFYKDQPSEMLSVGTSGDCVFYRSDNSSDFAFPILNSKDMSENYDLSDPFQVQNMIASELTGNDEVVFKQCDYEIISDDFYDDQNLWITSVKISVDDPSCIYFYSYPVYSTGNSGEAFHYPELYYNGNLISVCQSDLSSYIVDLGKGSGDIVFDIICKEHVEDFRFALLDEDALQRVFSDDPGFIITDTRFENSGISFNATSDSDRNMLITLPFEMGYHIFVDGIEVSYIDYHNAMLSIPVSAGEHMIKIAYFTPGLKAGIVISLISVLLFICFVVNDHKRIKNLKINNEN